MQRSRDISIIEQLANQVTIQRKQITLLAFKHTQPHNHCEREVWQITAGNGVLFSGRQIIKVSAGDIIQFNAFDYHAIKNPHGSPLVFMAYWYLDLTTLEAMLSKHSPTHQTILIGSAFPTPNGPLHLGHIAGPYLATYIMHTSYQLNGAHVLSYCGTYGNSNQINRSAEKLQVTTADLTQASENKIINNFNQLGINYDYFLVHNDTIQNQKLQQLAQHGDYVYNLEAFIQDILRYSTNTLLLEIEINFYRTRVYLQLHALELFAITSQAILTQLSKHIFSSLNLSQPNNANSANLMLNNFHSYTNLTLKPILSSPI